MKDGFLKAAALSPSLRVADCNYNASQIVSQLQDAAARGVRLAVFPEFCLTGYTCGDVYDRGPAPQLIMDELLSYPNVDVQWGNHDILWMGAAAGSPGSVANVVRICARYGNLSILEDAYGIKIGRAHV